MYFLGRGEKCVFTFFKSKFTLSFEAVLEEEKNASFFFFFFKSKGTLTFETVLELLKRRKSVRRAIGKKFSKVLHLVTFVQTSIHNRLLTFQNFCQEPMVRACASGTGTELGRNAVEGGTSKAAGVG